MMDDIPVLMHVMKEQMGLGRLLDENRPRHGNWSGMAQPLGGPHGRSGPLSARVMCW